MKHIFTALVFLMTIFSGLSKAQDYTKGQIIDINGVKALVFHVDENGHGTAMCLKALRGKENVWTSLPKKQMTTLFCNSTTDGKANTEAVFRFIADKGLDISSFPAFEWCKQLGEGWYIPSSKQLETFVNYWLGNDQSFDWESEDSAPMSDVNPKTINRLILDSGGIPFLSSRAGYVYTSTVDDNGRVTIFYYDGINGGAWKFKKSSLFSIDNNAIGRAFFDF